MKPIRVTLLLGCVLFLPGCGNSNVKLSGRVTFSDDGSPVPVGAVCFETETYSARGYLDADGRYIVGSLRETDGLPAGTYRVFVAGAEREIPNEKGGLPSVVYLVDPKYTSATTSGLTFEVDKEKRRFDFQVDRVR